jgi:hypothetical protein
MKSITHVIFSLGCAFAATAWFGATALTTAVPLGMRLLLAVWLAFIVNRVIDAGHTFKDTPHGYIPVRSWVTHGVFTAPRWGVGVGVVSVLGAWIALSQVFRDLSLGPPYALILLASFLGAVVAFSHLLPDSLTQAGVYYWKQRVAIAHWRHDNPLANLVFVILGLLLVFASLGVQSIAA